MRIPSHVTLALPGILLLFFLGCASTQPKLPIALGDNSALGKYSTNRFDADYRAYVGLIEANKKQDAQVIRDRMIEGILYEIETSYRKFEQEFYGGRAGQNTVLDMVELALSGATAAVGGETTKAALGAVLTGGKGARLSYEKNFFREKSTEVIVAAMQAERNKRHAVIITNMMDLDVDHYPFENAATDLIAFFYAGTIEGAMQNLAIETGQKAQTEKRNLEHAQAERLRIFKASREEIDLSHKVHRRVQELKTANNMAEARKALKQVDPVAEAAATTDAEVFQKFQDLEDKSDQDRSLIRKLADALGVNP